ncbi:MAG: gamma carbonic anhydrase family protein [Candidatus Thorarchaeota archaeon]|nr:MAG: gamma carbonic anhydrase family protein [Candidatus Thorarchaeota archaeon]RLI61928.1 MAG: gamma carbonic anhydrase family protein [Candidatus Thorarchaeota archaeon]
MVVYALGDKVPEIADSAYIHPLACVIGDVKIGENVFVAPQASIRGDIGRIEIGDESNIQDGVVIHSDPGFVTFIGRRVNIGHNASIHSEYIGNNAAIGMGAVLMVGSRVAEGALIANAALLHPKTVTEPYKIYAGVPAKYLRDFPEDDPARVTITGYVDSYVERTRTYPRVLRRLD